MAALDLDYLFFDADNHIYEPPEAYSRYMEPRFRDLAVHAGAAADEMSSRLSLREQVLGESSGGVASSMRGIAPPGSFLEFFRNAKRGEKSAPTALLSSERRDELPAASLTHDRAARIALMDEQRLEA